MAQHIANVQSSSIPKVSKSDFYRRMSPGDLLFCAGRNGIDHAIEDFTKSPWSHVLMVWLAGRWDSQWITLEATFTKGVSIGLLADYIEKYDGDLVMARRPLSTLDIQKAVNCGITLLDDRYDWQQEVSIAARKLIAELPLIEPKKELYCSGLQYVMSLATRYPLQRPAASYPTPEDNWTDPSVTPICALKKEL